MIGLYLSFAYIVLPVACLYCWRRGQLRLALALLIAPMAAWGLGELSGGLLSPFKRVHLGIGLLPLVLFPPLAALAWLASLATPGGSAPLPARAALPEWTRGGLLLAGILGVVWFLYGLFTMESACPMDTATLRTHLPRAALCLSSAAGTWPALIPTLLAGMATFVREQGAGATRDGTVR